MHLIFTRQLLAVARLLNKSVDDVLLSPYVEFIYWLDYLKAEERIKNPMQ